MLASRLFRFIGTPLERRIEALRKQAVVLCTGQDGLRHGCDYVIAATPLGSGHG